MKNSLKTLAIWLIIGIILIVLISAILDNSNTKLAYSDLIAKIETGEIGLPIEENNLVLPCGIYGKVSKN